MRSTSSELPTGTASASEVGSAIALGVALSSFLDPIRLVMLPVLVECGGSGHVRGSRNVFTNLTPTSEGLGKPLDCGELEQWEALALRAPMPHERPHSQTVGALLAPRRHPRLVLHPAASMSPACSRERVDGRGCGSASDCGSVLRRQYETTRRVSQFAPAPGTGAILRSAISTYAAVRHLLDC
jgi:hypothetical protein